MADWRAPAWALPAILVLAATLRLVALTDVPPGFNQDEAANAWNAYCVLKTGQDQVGQRWPIFYYRALGEHRSALFLYVLMPFQMIGGLNIWTSRLPAVVGGVLTILLAHWVTRRMFGSAVALTGAGLLAINHVHVQISRTGHEASITPLLALVPLAALLWAGFPLADRPATAGRPLRALLAGLVGGVLCYGYPAVRLFVPLFLGACVLVTGRWWLEQIRAARGRWALVALLAGWLATFGPLLYAHVSRPDVIGRRGFNNWVWRADDPLGQRVERVARRYVQHFDPGFLYRQGDEDVKFWVPAFGFVPGYFLPLHLFGLGVLLRRAWASRAARVLLAAVVLYPAGDVLNWHISLHGLRSLPGLIPLVVVAAVGLVWLIKHLGGQRRMGMLVAALVALGWLAAASQARFARAYYAGRQRDMVAYLDSGADVLAAYRWLRPELDSADAVVCTALGMKHTHLLLLVDLGYEPARWFAEPREYLEWVDYDMWDRYTRFGKYYFLYDEERTALLERLRGSGRPQRVFFILRPDERPPGPPRHEIHGPDGHTTLVIYELRVNQQRRAVRSGAAVLPTCRLPRPGAGQGCMVPRASSIRASKSAIHCLIMTSSSSAVALRTFLPNSTACCGLILGDATIMFGMLGIPRSTMRCQSSCSLAWFSPVTACA